MIVHGGMWVKCNECDAIATPADKVGPALTNAINEGFVIDDDNYFTVAFCADHVPARLLKKVKS